MENEGGETTYLVLKAAEGPSTERIGTFVWSCRCSLIACCVALCVRHGGFAGDEERERKGEENWVDATKWGV